MFIYSLGAYNLAAYNEKANMLKVVICFIFVQMYMMTEFAMGLNHLMDEHKDVVSFMLDSIFLRAK